MSTEDTIEQHLVWSAQDGWDDEVRRILKTHPEVDVNWRNQSFGWGALHVACRWGHHSVISMLLAHPDINVELEDNLGCTPFYLACQCSIFFVGESPPAEGEGSPLRPAMTKAAFAKLDTQQVINFLVGEGVHLEEGDLHIFERERLDGEALNDTSKADLERYGLPGGLATKIMKKVPHS